MAKSSQIAAIGAAIGLALGSLAPIPTAHAQEKAAPTLKVAVVDVQRAVTETEDGLRALATLRKYFDRRQAEISRRQNLLAARKQDIDRQAKVLSKQATQRAIVAWQKDLENTQQMYMRYQSQLQSKRLQVMEPILRRLQGLLRRLATQEGYDLILDRQAVPYVRSDMDLTDRVIGMYNAGVEPVPAKGKKGKGAGPTLKLNAPTPPKAATPGKPNRKPGKKTGK